MDWAVYVWRRGVYAVYWLFTFGIEFELFRGLPFLSYMFFNFRRPVLDVSKLGKCHVDVKVEGVKKIRFLIFL